jgi:hypothetical protein
MAVSPVSPHIPHTFDRRRSVLSSTPSFSWVLIETKRGRNRFNGFASVPQTVETVFGPARCPPS